MQHIELEVDIAASNHVVWDLITNWPKQSEWMLATKVTGTAAAVGEKIHAFTGIWSIGFLDIMEVTTWEPPTRCDVLHIGKVVRGTGSFQVVAIDDKSCKFIWIEDLNIPLGFIGMLGFKILRPFFVLGVKLSLNKFAKQASENSS